MKWKVSRRVMVVGGLMMIGLGVGLWWQVWNRVSGVPVEVGLKPYDAAPLSRWPWANARPEILSRGLTRWVAKQNDGTICDLMAFDFGTNAGLKFGIFDQDEDDAVPFDNRVKYWPRGAAQMTRELNVRFAQKQQGKIVALWNGAFFGYADGSPSQQGSAFHVSPVVLGGKVHFNTANHRWAWGCKYLQGRPQFKMFHLPSREVLEREFDWAAGSVQCLVKNGQPLKLEPFPKNADDFKPQPVASTPQEVGHVPIFDHMKTCRASLAWSRDNRKLWLLIIKEPDIEAGSAVALKRALPISGGWTVADVQRFWLSRGVWGAMNSDAGDVAQLVTQTRNGYEMIPPRWADNRMRFKLKNDWSNAPRGGSLMYFYVRDEKA